MEELILKKVNGGIRAIKLGTKTPEEARVGYWLNRLKEINSVWNNRAHWVNINDTSSDCKLTRT